MWIKVKALFKPDTDEEESDEILALKGEIPQPKPDDIAINSDALEAFYPDEDPCNTVVFLRNGESFVLLISFDALMEVLTNELVFYGQN